MRKIFSCLILSAAIGAAAPEPVRLWPAAAPGDTATLGQERDTTTEKDRAVAGRPVVRITDVSVPTLTVYRPPKEKDTGAAVLVFPGGGWRILAIDLEGTEVCEWLNSIGITAILVKYRVPARPNTPRYLAAVQDGQRAISLVRSRAAEWGLDPARIGVIGFSAGAHLAAAVSTNFEKPLYPRQDAADTASSRPDFALVIYPGGVADAAGKLSPELTVTANTPPAFIVQAEDDSVRVENAIAYYMALKNAKVPAEMHLYPTGGHGYGLRITDLAVTTWPARAEEWLRAQGVMRAAAKIPSGSPFVYKTVDGRQLRLWVVRPAGLAAGSRAPAIVFYHGGGWVGGTPTQFEPQGDYLATRGMVAVKVEYRFVKAKTTEPPDVCIQDAKSAMRWVRSHADRLGVDPDRIAAGGGSAGGHLAAFLGLVDGFDDPRDDRAISVKPNALVLFNPVFDNGPEGWGHERVGDRYMEYSPFHHVSAAAPPAIVLAGANDKLLPAATVRAFQAAMRKAGVRCEIVIYEGQEHGFFNRGTSYFEALRAADEFLISLGWLKGPSAVTVPK